MNLGIEVIDLFAAGLTLAFMLKLLFSADRDGEAQKSAAREKVSLLHQHVASRIRMAH